MGARVENRPAFDGASFDKKGFCINHPTCQLTNPTKIDGRLAYEELKRCCPSCVSDKNKSKRVTSLGGGKVREGRVHGTPIRDPKLRSSSRSRKKEKPRREHDTPFDEKGRCHYHYNVQLATKKLGGGWKVLQSACPKCMEEGNNDDRSVKSGSSRKSSSSRKKKPHHNEQDGDDRSVRSGSSKKQSGKSKLESQLEDVNAKNQFDKNGCCLKHGHIQVAKKKMLGGWKVMRSCPTCNGDQDIGLDDDHFSVCSKSSRKSARSTSSRKSSRSHKSSKSKSKPGQAATSSRYGNLPFDGDGYCCQHPSIQIAQKKMMGGWKIIHDVCPDCAHDNKGTKRAPRRKSSSGSGRTADAAAASETSSHKSSTGGSSLKQKRIRVKNLKTEDENGKKGKYTGYVDENYRPNGSGVMKYDDETIYEGVWSEGSQVHGKTKKKQIKN